MVEGSASTVINCSAVKVFDAITDVTRMGDWSPECTGGRWVGPATGPGVGASFEGDNIAKLGPVTLKKWTTTSEVTECERAKVFEFVAGEITTWRYELEERDGATTVTESFSFVALEGWKKFVYETVARRSATMVKGMQQTLGRMKETLEG